MNHIKIAASLDDTGELRKTMLDNPELPIMIFVGEESYSGEYPYSLAEISSTGIREQGSDFMIHVRKEVDRAANLLTETR